jgi:hypothetical protein
MSYYNEERRVCSAQRTSLACKAIRSEHGVACRRCFVHMHSVNIQNRVYEAVYFGHLCLPMHSIKLNSVALVRKRTIPTEQPPLVGEVSANFCG